jgi:tripartite-type tricarboxylate transporter receptor subunit TctC
VPTVAESGGPAGYEVTGWTTLALPKGLPKPVQDKLQQDVLAALAEPDMKERFATFGYDSFPATREQFNAFIATELAKYGDVVKRTRASLD